MAKLNTLLVKDLNFLAPEPNLLFLFLIFDLATADFGKI